MIRFALRLGVLSSPARLAVLSNLTNRTAMPTKQYQVQPNSTAPRGVGSSKIVGNYTLMTKSSNVPQFMAEIGAGWWLSHVAPYLQINIDININQPLPPGWQSTFYLEEESLWDLRSWCYEKRFKLGQPFEETVYRTRFIVVARMVDPHIMEMLYTSTDKKKASFVIYLEFHGDWAILRAWNSSRGTELQEMRQTYCELMFERL